MPNQVDYQLTPLIEELLSIVQKTCCPSNKDWQAEFVNQIRNVFYVTPSSGMPIHAEDEVKRDMRLLAVERIVTSRQQRTKSITIDTFTF